MSSASTPTIGPLDPRRAAPLLLKAGDVVAARYEVLRHLGSGGSAHVYAVRDHRIGDDIALKLLRDDVDVERSRREAEYARGSSSPRLVRTFDLVEADGLTFLTMELVPGGSLKKRLENGPLPTDEVIRLGIEVLEAVADLHRLDVVHRDLKPGNLLLTEDGHVKLSDFGIARRWTDDESRLTVTGATLGTIDYLSPEQASGVDADPRSDLFSCGVLLFEMLTGRVPFEASTKVAAIGMRLQQRAVDVRTLRRDTPRWLAALIARLLETKREDRYPDADAVLRDLRRQRVRPPVPRFLTLAMVCIVAVALSFGAWWMTHTPAETFADIGEWGMNAIDRNGRTRWMTLQTRSSHVALVRRGRDREVAAILAPSPDAVKGTAAGRILSFVDAYDGEFLRSVPLPDARYSFPEHSDRFAVSQIRAADLNHDGCDEVIIAYAHDYYPSYIVVHDSRTSINRVVFVASGQHQVADIADLDRDGIDDLIVVGTANRMGWYTGVGGIRVRFDGGPYDSLGFTPDRLETSPRNSLLWYALCPAGTMPRAGVVTADPRSRTIAIPYKVDQRITLSFDGFFGGTRAGGDRATARADAYEHLRQAQRFIPDAAPAAIEEAEIARAFAVKADDATLEEWCVRTKATAMIHAGRTAEATQLFNGLLEHSDAASDAAWDAANAFHLAGDLTRAVDWYRESLGRRSHPWFGRLKAEILMGVVLALGESHRWSEAQQEVDRFVRMHADERDHARWYRLFIGWRTGHPTRSPYPIDQATDHYRYWSIENALAAGADPERVLQWLDIENKRASETRRLLPLARAEALRRLGRLDDAFSEADAAYRDLYGYHRTYVLDHAHLGLAEERVRRIAAEAGKDWHPNGMAR